MALYEITCEEVTKTVRELALNANFYLPENVQNLIARAQERELVPSAHAVLGEIRENIRMAAEKRMPLCQDCGMAVIFAEIGQDVHITGGDVNDAINAGVRSAYCDGYLRKSVVKDPLYERKNTGDNTPAVIHWSIVPGHTLRITLTPKGMGSENMSRIFMLKPADGEEGVINAVVDAARQAGPNPCPPIIVGVGIGGNFETAALAAKRALLMDERNSNPRYAALETKILNEINKLGIGAAGIGGITTALDVHINAIPTHIAGMPVAVNMCCHALRHAAAAIDGICKEEGVM